MRTPQFVQLHTGDAVADREALAQGLLAPRASLEPKWFYDAQGARLFDAITALDEYYPTRTERAIFDAHGPAMADALGRGLTLVDLGAGDGAKAERLFPLLQPAAYVAVDISTGHLRQALSHMQMRHPAMPLLAVGTDFSQNLRLPPEAGTGPRLMFYPGSSIGNFTPEAALAFLRQVHAAAQGGGLLIGVDLVKDRATLEAAYDDALGVTAAFNLNALRHVNRVLGSDFRIGQWRHHALFNTQASRIEMHLQAREALVVRWPGGERRFEAGEGIHSENSCKWRVDDFAALLRDAGFAAPQAWLDERGWFAVLAAKA
jgi:dimethylhistidine N-methyltransferase